LVLDRLLPGGHLLAFAGTRTQHRMAVRIEDAGFEIRDMLAWVYGSGFPKSLDVVKAIDKAEGAERRIIAEGAPAKRMIPGADQHATGSWIKDNGRVFVPTTTEPATDAARQWDGWGTALKPSFEPITLARRPLVGTVAQNVQAHGTGALNIDGCRVPTDEVLRAGTGNIPCRHDQSQPRGRTGEASAQRRYTENGGTDFAMTPGPRGGDPAGRWPANLIHDGSEEVLALFPDSKGQQGDLRATGRARPSSGRFGDMAPPTPHPARNDTGSAARFFKQCSFNEGDACDLANIAVRLSDQQKPFDASALVRAVSTVLPEELCAAVSLSEPLTTSATGRQLETLCASAMQAIQTFGPRFWREPQPGELSLTLNRVNVAAHRTPTGITTITVSHWRSDGSAEPVTFIITPTSSAVGAKDSVPSTAARLMYCAKARASERGAGNDHPTVKPLALMRWLLTLVVPPHGLVLDPFLGSGSTGVAAIEMGMRFIGIERDRKSFEIACARIEAAQRQGRMFSPEPPEMPEQASMGLA